MNEFFYLKQKWYLDYYDFLLKSANLKNCDINKDHA